MTSAPSTCPSCGEPGRWGSDDDWVHETVGAALACDREGFSPFDEPEEAVSLLQAVLREGRSHE